MYVLLDDTLCDMNGGASGDAVKRWEGEQVRCDVTGPRPASRRRSARRSSQSWRGAVRGQSSLCECARECADNSSRNVVLQDIFYLPSKPTANVSDNSRSSPLF